MSVDSVTLMQVGLVTIGRNEGARLEACLEAIRTLYPQMRVVYVDSGSTDNSVTFAQSLGVEVVALSSDRPFNMARARNAGFARLLMLQPDLRYVQFLDGDCVIQAGWLESALAAFSQSPDIGIVSGLRRERYPDASIYNAILDRDWNGPIGNTLAVTGDMCVRQELFQALGGFFETLIAGEDEDFCLRTRRAGKKVWRLNSLMSLHNAEIMRLSQWYRRSRRTGHVYANIYHWYGRGPERYYQRQVRSAVLWGAVVPLCFVLALVWQPIVAMLIGGGYLLYFCRMLWRRYKQTHNMQLALAYAWLIASGKFPEFLGMLQYVSRAVLKKRHTLIEYK